MPDNPSGALLGSNGIGALRWLVTLYRRDQAPADDMALIEHLVPIATVHADIQPTYASTFYQSTQVDTPITHMINIRWQDYPATIETVVRTTKRPSDGGLRTELFRVRRTKEVAGRKRFLQLECELEHSRLTPDDSDQTRNDLLTEPYGTPIPWDNGDTVWDAWTPNDTPWDIPVWPTPRTPWDDGTTEWDALAPHDTAWDLPASPGPRTFWDGGASEWDAALTAWDGAS